MPTAARNLGVAAVVGRVVSLHAAGNRIGRGFHVRSRPNSEAIDKLTHDHCPGTGSQAHAPMLLPLSAWRALTGDVSMIVYACISDPP